MAKRLITEACVKALSPDAVLEIDGQTLITPAALDLAFARGIPVLREGEARQKSSGQSSNKECCQNAIAQWHDMLSADGTYVVVVRDGKPSISRLGADGPQAL